MTTLPLKRAANRIFKGMTPEFYDQVLFSYPTDTSIELTFSYIDDNTGNHVVAAIIELVYTDNKQVALASARRIL